MRPRIEIKPVWANMSDDDLKKKLAAIKQTRDLDATVDHSVSSEEPRVALVMRYLEKNTISRFFSSAESDEARKLCEEVLKFKPNNNFFNFALAALVDDVELRKKYLQAAAVSTEPYGEALSGQAAFELAKYAIKAQVPGSMMSYIEVEAWFARAVMLGDQDAVKHFNQYGLYHDDMTLFAMLSLSNCQGLYTSFLAVILSGRKIADFLESSLLNNKCESPRILQSSPLRVAHAMSAPLLALEKEGSAVRRIADEIIANHSSEYFYHFFRYSFDARIISKDVYEGVLSYLSNCGLEISPELIEQIKSEQIRLQQQDSPRALLDLPVGAGAGLFGQSLFNVSAQTGVQVPQPSQSSQSSVSPRMVVQSLI